MKSVKLAVALSLLLVSSFVFAVQPKTTLTVERIIIVNNGTSSGKSITSHTFSKRFFSESECIVARDAYRAENLLKIGPNSLNSEAATRAECDALDHSTAVPAGY